MTQITNDSQWQIFERRGAPSGSYPDGWVQFLAISHQCMVVIDCRKAIIDGWNMDRATYQGADAWPGMTAEEILSWRMQSDAHHGVSVQRVTNPGTVERARQKATEAANEAVSRGTAEPLSR